MGNGLPLYVINVWNMRAGLARRIDFSDGGSGYEEADNWQELEEEAAEIIEDQGGAINISGLYPCPHEFSEKGVWAKKPNITEEQ